MIHFNQTWSQVPHLIYVVILTRFGNGEFKNVHEFKREAYRLKELSKLKRPLPGLLREPHWEEKYPMLTDEALHSYLDKLVIPGVIINNLF